MTIYDMFFFLNVVITRNGSKNVHIWIVIARKKTINSIKIRNQKQQINQYSKRYGTNMFIESMRFIFVKSDKYWLTGIENISEQSLKFYEQVKKVKFPWGSRE